MNIITQMLLLTFTAMTMENIVFTRALGTGKIFMTGKTPFGAILFGAVHTAVITICCLITSLISPVLNKTSVRYFLEPLVYVGLLIIFYFIAYFVVSWHTLGKNESVNKIAKTIALSCFNNAVLGSIMIVSRRSLTPAQAIFYGLGCGLGFVIAVFFMEEQKKRIKLSKIPKSFRSTAVTLIYIGIISLALYGLIGHQLTA